MCKCPIEFPGLSVDGTEGKSAIADASRRNHFRVVPGRENLICFLEVLIGECLLYYGDAAIAQKADHPLSCNASEESAIEKRSKHDSIFRHENIRSSELGDVAQHIAHDSVVEAAGLRFKKRTRIVGIEASRLGINRHRLQSWPAIRRQRDRKAFRRAHRRLVDREAPLGGLRIMRLNPWSFFFRPVHGANVKCGIPVELLDSFARQLDPGFRRDRRLEKKFLRRVIDAGAMQLEVRRDAFKKSRSIEHNRTKPRSMRARTHDPDVALVPISLEISPGFRPPAPDCQSSPPWLPRIGARVSRWTSLKALPGKIN